MLRIAQTIFAALALVSTVPANSGVVILTFEGIGDAVPIGAYYGAHGISFSPAATALVDFDVGGSGNFANEPSPDAIMVGADPDPDTGEVGRLMLNAAAGFTDGVGFYFTAFAPGTVTVYEGLNGTGVVLASFSLPMQYNIGCQGDPTGGGCNWTKAAARFAGTAHSIDFGANAAYIGFDDVTLGAPVPEPASWLLLIGGFFITGATMRRRRFKVA